MSSVPTCGISRYPTPTTTNPFFISPSGHGALAARETAAVEPHHHRRILRIGRAGHVKAAHPTRIVAGGIRTVEDVAFEAVVGRMDGTGEQETEKQKEKAFHLQRSFGFVDKSSENP